MLHIPPFNYVNFVLQRDSAIYGLASPSISKYCSRLLKFASKVVPDEGRHLLKPFNKMVSSSKTVSDEIIKLADGFTEGRAISNKDAAELALKLAGGMEKEISAAEKRLEKIAP